MIANLPRDTAARLEEMARKLDRPPDDLAAELIESGLNRQTEHLDMIAWEAVVELSKKYGFRWGSPVSARNWVNAYEAANPGLIIRRKKGRVHKGDILDALKDARKPTAGDGEEPLPAPETQSRDTADM